MATYQDPRYTFQYGLSNPAPQSTFTGMRIAPSSQPSLQVKPPGQVLGASTGPIRSPAPSPILSNPFGGANDAAAAQNAALLSQLNTQYDQSAEQLNQQLGSLGTQRGQALSSLDTSFQGVTSQVDKSRKSAQDSTDTNVQDALSTAQDVERSNRNKLRALGILNSSAAGELLSKPLNEYDKQRGVLFKALQDRNGELDDFLTQKTAEHSQAVQQIESQYADLVGRIQSDLRFNQRQRADALQAANAALQQRMSEIQTAQFNYQAQVEAAKQQSAAAISSLNAYQATPNNLSGIQNATVQPGANNPASSNAQIFDDPNQKKKLSFLA